MLVRGHQAAELLEEQRVDLVWKISWELGFLLTPNRHPVGDWRKDPFDHHLLLVLFE